MESLAEFDSYISRWEAELQEFSRVAADETFHTKENERLATELASTKEELFAEKHTTAVLNQKLERFQKEQTAYLDMGKTDLEHMWKATFSELQETIRTQRRQIFDLSARVQEADARLLEKEIEKQSPERLVSAPEAGLEEVVHFLRGAVQRLEASLGWCEEEVENKKKSLEEMAGEAAALQTARAALDEKCRQLDQEVLSLKTERKGFEQELLRKDSYIKELTCGTRVPFDTDSSSGIKTEADQARTDLAAALLQALGVTARLAKFEACRPVLGIEPQINMHVHGEPQTPTQSELEVVDVQIVETTRDLESVLDEFCA
ncbi:MAG: uncharacterized protein KVP18_002988 [Porospora cf. gigantea A]|uniref:uncharacterized protein n=1 Tax=Porospora cf. gigantea A TaxID=2853593 RepID=UPI00355AA5E4|nr:MAG: hypothetical protein KVP18_002988 [Porospora cf. gigantea A]